MNNMKLTSKNASLNVSPKDGCWAILDSFHQHVNGNKTPEVRSDNPCFKNIEEFFTWCSQHGADGKWYRVKNNRR